MSSIFKKIKSAFIIEEGSDKQTSEEFKESASQETAGVEAASTPEELPVNLEVQSGDGEINPRFTDILLKALEANNQEGFDYIEFKRSLQNLLKMNMEEDTVYKSAYATAQTLGATPNGLISSAQRYLNVLKKEEDKFKVALNNQRAKQIDGGQQEVKQLEHGIEGKRKQIQKLQQEIEQSENHLAKLQGEIKASAQKIEDTRSDFVASYLNLVKQIEQDIENIGKYLN